ncbi:AAA family ATPase [Streptomyces sp. 4.24]|uniref:helix-turn-helix transcriptional regulator n=1 Tax=Streptomyces tritrimontium TaxID=3406573 RepID=UPI003BB56BB8
MESAETRTPRQLVGREQETARLDALVGALPRRDSGQALMLHGRPGMGKTALLDGCAAGARATGALVLRAAGVRTEASLPYAALHQALWPVQDELNEPHELPCPQRTALRSALDAGDTSRADVFGLSTAVLTLLHSSARERPVLLVLDDAHWFDPESRAVFGFLSRRLAGTRISLVAATADSADPYLDDARTAARSLSPLSSTDAAEMLDARHPALAPEARRRIIEAAGGSPLVLAELPGALSDAQLAGHEPLPVLLPLSPPLRRVYGPLLEALPEEVRELLLLAALEANGSTRTVWAAYRHGWEAAGEALVAAEQAGVLRVAGERGLLVFTEPLLRSAVVAAAAPDRVRAAHRALASVLDHEPDEQVRHLAASAVGLDPAAAGALAAGAARAARHGLEHLALTAHSRAADLSGNPAERAELLALAAHSAGRAGRFAIAADLLGQASAQAPLPEGPAFALAHAQLLAERDGDSRSAFQLLLGAFDSCGDAPGDGSGPRGAWRDALLTRLFSLAVLSGDAEQWHATASRLGTGPSWARLVKRLSAPVTDGAPRNPSRMVTAVKDLPADAGSSEVLRLAHLAVAQDGLGPLQDRLRQVVEASERGGAVADCADALGLLGLDLLLGGRRDDAEKVTSRMRRLAEEHGLVLTAWRATAQSALIAAAGGDTGTARALIRELTPMNCLSGQTSLMVHQASAWAALSEGAYAEAYAHALRASATAADGAALSPLHPWVFLTLVESAVLTGRAHEGHMHLSAAQAAGLPQRSGRHLLLVAGARAILAPPQQAESLFETLLGSTEQERHPFECARLRLALDRTGHTGHTHGEGRGGVVGGAGGGSTGGGVLQAEVRTDAVRAVIRRPQREHERADVTPLLPVPAGAPGNPAELTRQELQIGRLAASGLSNKEIGRRLYLSPRTVSTHLYNLFPKLGITSRASLYQKLSELGYHEETRPAEAAR